jgi:hypothetical protein
LGERHHVENLEVDPPSSSSLWDRFCIIAGTIGIYCGALQLLGNVHVFVERPFYRSEQLDKVTLARVIQEHGIKSILNLLGASPNKSWYADEIAISKALGAAHYDYGISANEVVAPDKIDEILQSYARSLSQSLSTAKMAQTEVGSSRQSILLTYRV